MVKTEEVIDHIQFIVIDLFCGAGGTTTGYEEAEFDYSSLYKFLKSVGISAPREKELFIKVAKVVACVNHDPIAIKSHWANYPWVYHFEEDITKLYGQIYNGILFRSPNFMRLVRLIEMYRAFYPEAIIILWASLECTNFSKAKGGMSRDADSRTLANHLFPYIIAIDPDYVKIENVVEFKKWGPLIVKEVVSKDGYKSCPLNIKKDRKTKQFIVQPHYIPDPQREGEYWYKWIDDINKLGYRDEWRELNSANYGALTSRNRLFGCFAKGELPIIWPEPSHTKNPGKNTLFKELKKWEPVKKALDFSDEGQSVFNRKKPLSPKTMQRLYMGCIKHIAGGKEKYNQNRAFIVKWNSNRQGTGGNNGHSIEDPSPVVTTQNRLGVAFITKAFSANSNKSVNSGSSIDNPCPTIAAQNRLGLAQIHFISKYNGVNGGKHDNSGSIDEPAGTLSTKDRFSKVQAEFFLHKYYNGDNNHQSVEDPAGAILPNDKHGLVKAYLMNPSWGGNSGSIESPCPVVVARQDKAPLYLITIEEGIVAIPVYEGDCEWTIKLKEFMVLYGIADIKMRMLKVMELKLIQGFPHDYILHGNQTDQKKFIGNAVHPIVSKSWIKAKSEVFSNIAA